MSSGGVIIGVRLFLEALVIVFVAMIIATTITCGILSLENALLL